MSYRDPEEKNIKNDFAPNMRNEYITEQYLPTSRSSENKTNAPMCLV